MRDVLVLGSTGSVGTQTLQVIESANDRFRAVGIAAAGSDPDLLAAQVQATGCPRVAVLQPAAAAQLRRQLGRGVQIFAGPDAISELIATGADVVLNAITGAAGLPATMATLASGATLALANKESLIMAGALVTRAAAPGQIVPVDSEHSAIAQCLRSGSTAEVDRLIITASGGPFRGLTASQLRRVTPADALNHPTWNMGQVITTNSATLVNKALEVLEAHLLFGVPMERIDVVVHPQSVVHSLVQFQDGSSVAQCSPPSMLLPIALALGWPDRVPHAAPAIDWTQAQQWSFEPVDQETFPAITLIRECAAAGGATPAVFNAANEVAVAAFHSQQLSFPEIVGTIAAVVAEYLRSPVAPPADLAGVLAVDSWARTRAARRIADA